MADTTDGVLRQNTPKAIPPVSIEPTNNLFEIFMLSSFFN
jgi:hypothetical protein